MKNLFALLLLSLFYILNSTFFIPPAFAVVNPLSVPNNKFGIHIISPTPEESQPAANMVNSNGDWGYITVLIQSGDLNQNKWQTFFNELRRKHLIPIIRLATHPDQDFWVRPFANEESAWADFLDSLNWPTKNRYISIYNEPNHAQEWANTVDPKDYAQTLNKTIDALKAKNNDFFVLNAGLDASAPQKMPAYMDEKEFLKEMNDEIPGIFDKLDGWVSHSYPNPGFSGLPTDTGKGTVKTFEWEIQILKGLGLKKNLPIFITETGWKHAEGINLDRSLPSTDKVAGFYKQAFENAWASNQIVAVTPFLLSYQDVPFDHFSFKKYTGGKQNNKILGAEYPDYLPQYQTLMDLPKVAGKPVQDTRAKLVKGEIFSSIVAGQSYKIPLTFENTGQSIWNDGIPIHLVPSGDVDKLGLGPIDLPLVKKVEPNGQHTFIVNLKAPTSGKYHVKFNLYIGSQKFDSDPFEFNTEVKSPVVLKIKSNLQWKKDFSGDYFLGVMGVIGNTLNKISLNQNGESEEVNANYLLPDYDFDFTLQKPFYQTKTIHRHVTSGENILDFGQLQPDIPSAILNPQELWKLLPMSN